MAKVASLRYIRKFAIYVFVLNEFCCGMYWNGRERESGVKTRNCVFQLQMGFLSARALSIGVYIERLAPKLEFLPLRGVLETGARSRPCLCPLTKEVQSTMFLAPGRLIQSYYLIHIRTIGVKRDKKISVLLYIVVFHINKVLLFLIKGKLSRLFVNVHIKTQNFLPSCQLFHMENNKNIAV